MGSARTTKRSTSPDQIETLLDAFYALPPADAERFLRWCFWVNHADQVSHLARSSAHIAVVQAIEALMPPADDSGTCECCGHRLGPGPTARFADFLGSLVPATDSDDDRPHEELYALRSALSHGGKLLQDELFRRATDLHLPKLTRMKY